MSENKIMGFLWGLLVGFVLTSLYDYTYIQKPLETKLENCKGINIELDLKK